MTVLYTILVLIAILLIGFFKIIRTSNKVIDKHNFIFDYQQKFVKFVNSYFENHSRFSNINSSFDGELYMWLTKNVYKVQDILGHSGTMNYIASFQRFHIPNYQIVINTLPKFRDSTVEIFDVNSTDDCLLRYLGHLDEIIVNSKKTLKNPFIWFRIGIQEVVSIPLLILKWFGVFSNNAVNKIIGGTFYKIISGIIALITLVSGIVTIIVGKDQTIDFIRNIFGK